jgi:hypothetical protein
MTQRPLPISFAGVQPKILQNQAATNAAQGELLSTAKAARVQLTVLAQSSATPVAARRAADIDAENCATGWRAATHHFADCRPK